MKDNERRVTVAPAVSIRRGAYDEAKQIKAVASSHPYTKHFSHPAYCNRPAFAAGNVIVATVNNTIVGLCSIRPKPTRNETEVDIICVMPEYRSYGIGAKLLDYVRKNLTTAVITLNVQTDNTRALAFYLNYGFSRRGTITVANTEAYRMRMVCKRGVLI